MRRLIQIELPFCPGDALALACAAQAIGAGKELEVLIDRETGHRAKTSAPRSRVVWRASAREVRRSAPATRKVPLGGGQQAAEHAEGRAFACAVRAEESEDLAAADAEADMIDRGEVAEGAHEIMHFDRHPVRRCRFAAARASSWLRWSPAATARNSIMKPSSKRGGTGSSVTAIPSRLQRALVIGGCAHDANLAGFGNGIDDAWLLEQPRLKGARRHAACRAWR